MNTKGLAKKRNLAEFSAIFLAGITHIVLEIIYGDTVSGVFSVIVVALFAFYLGYRLFNDRTLLRSWGFRTDNLNKSLKYYVDPIIIGAVFLSFLGLYNNGVFITWGVVISMLVYSLWGIAQQFVLQNLIASNIKPYFNSPLTHSFVVSSVFAISHYPRILLAGFAFLVGFLLTLVYQYKPNIWLAGIAHGVLATLLFYWVYSFDLSVWFKEILVNLF